MGIKPERQFRESVHKHIPKTLVHRQPGGSSYVAGVPDTRYSGPGGVLWVEWKFFQTIPPEWNLARPVMRSHKVRLSPLQLAWIEREYEYDNGTHMAVIVGHKGGGIFLTAKAWATTFTRDAFLKHCKSRKELAEDIIRFTTGRG